MPPELTLVADRLTVILPWGSLLAAVARPSLPALTAIRRVCRPGARVTVVLGGDPARDAAELARLGIPSASLFERAHDIAAGYASAGLALSCLREIDASSLAEWPSTWARRLAHARGRRFWLLEGTVDAEPR
jgi:hypothetical protein